MPRSQRPAIPEDPLAPDKKSVHYLDTAEYDQPEYRGEPRHYIVCATPRSGSTLLCDLLTRSGVLGVPHEYFNLKTHLPAIASRLGIYHKGRARFSEYIPAIKRLRTTPSGVFGLKFHFVQCYNLCKRIRLAKAFPEPVFVAITRGDKLAQAVSLELAFQTNQWTSRHASYGTPVYDAKRITTNLTSVLQQEIDWAKFFCVHGIEPLRITYEELLADAPGQCRRVAEAMDVQTDFPFTLDTASVKKQGTELNAAWIERFQQENRLF